MFCPVVDRQGMVYGLMIRKATRRILENTTTPPMKRRLLKARDYLLDFNVHTRKMLGSLGSLPDFIIIGAQKGGTTYLYHELVKHPYITPAITKEIHFFDIKYAKGANWYRSCFPISTNGFITGEASPCYIFHPHTPRRVFQLIPRAKLIVLLRDPVNRAYSHYRHLVRLGYETLSFEEAIGREHERLCGEKEKMLDDGNYYSYEYMHHSYLARGIYYDQLMVWMSLFPKEQLLILRSEDFFRDTPKTIKKVVEFLGLPPWQLEEYGRPRISSYPEMSEKARTFLLEYFGPHNQRLFDYLGVDFEWERR